MKIPAASRLGSISAVTIGTPDLDNSLLFYQQLGFIETGRMEYPFPWIQLSDGAMLIMLRKQAQPYIALTYYLQDIDTIVAALEQDGIVFVMKTAPGDMVNRCLLQSPDGINIGLVGFADGFSKPAGKTLLTMAPEDFFNPASYTNQSCGIFGEFAQPVADIEKSIAFWTLLGFSTLSKRESPYPWAILSDGTSIIGLHQTGHFTEPAITFFAADIKDKVAKLKANGMTGFIEKGQGNFTLTTPEKQYINLFKLGR